jgi:hypothetical protein
VLKVSWYDRLEDYPADIAAEMEADGGGRILPCQNGKSD